MIFKLLKNALYVGKKYGKVISSLVEVAEIAGGYAKDRKEEIKTSDPDYANKIMNDIIAEEKKIGLEINNAKQFAEDSSKAKKELVMSELKKLMDERDREDKTTIRISSGIVEMVVAIKY